MVFPNHFASPSISVIVDMSTPFSTVGAVAILETMPRHTLLTEIKLCTPATRKQTKKCFIRMIAARNILVWKWF
jgi:hypothetical protein